MSLAATTHIIGRALVEPAYRALLFDDPRAALAGYALTDEETLALKRISREQFAAVDAELRERVALALVLSERAPASAARDAVHTTLNDLFDWET